MNHSTHGRAPIAVAMALVIAGSGAGARDAEALETSCTLSLSPTDAALVYQKFRKQRKAGYAVGTTNKVGWTVRGKSPANGSGLPVDANSWWIAGSTRTLFRIGKFMLGDNYWVDHDDMVDLSYGGGVLSVRFIYAPAPIMQTLTYNPKRQIYDSASASSAFSTSTSSTTGNF